MTELFCSSEKHPKDLKCLTNHIMWYYNIGFHSFWTVTALTYVFQRQVFLKGGSLLMFVIFFTKLSNGLQLANLIHKALSYPVAGFKQKSNCFVTFRYRTKALCHSICIHPSELQQLPRENCTSFLSLSGKPQVYDLQSKQTKLPCLKEKQKPKMKPKAV